MCLTVAVILELTILCKKASILNIDLKADTTWSCFVELLSRTLKGRDSFFCKCDKLRSPLSRFICRGGGGVRIQKQTKNECT